MLYVCTYVTKLALQLQAKTNPVLSYFVPIVYSSYYAITLHYHFE